MSNFIAQLSLSARIDGQEASIENGLFSVIDQSIVEVWCTGSGALSWGSSLGEPIPLNSPSHNTYQTNDPTQNFQRLVIQPFSGPSNTALYTCTTDLVVSGNTFAESAFITSCKSKFN